MYSGIDIYEGVLSAGKRRIAKIFGNRFPDIFINKICNPLFIIGCGRSGTSMLTRLLRTHKDICNFSEANEIWDPKGYPWYYSNLNRPPIWYDADPYIKAWREYFDDDYKKNLKAIFGCYQYISRKKIFMNKSPMNSLRVPDILEIFPDAKLIHIIRDGRAVAFSWAKKQYITVKKHEAIYRKRGYYYDFDELIKLISKSWIQHIEEINKQKEKLNLVDKGIMFEFTYEDLCKRPDEHIDSICSFLSIDRDKFRTKDFSYIKSMNYKWKENLDEKTIDEINNILLTTLKKIY